MPKTPVGANLLQTLKILTELVVQHVSHDLRHTLCWRQKNMHRMSNDNLVSLSVLDVPLPVKEPVGNLVLAGVLEGPTLCKCLMSILSCKLK